MKSLNRTDYWIVAAVLVVTLAATSVLWIYEKRQEFGRGQAAFEVLSETVSRDLRDTMRAYGLFLRGGVSHFRATDGVSRLSWQRYVTNLDLELNYPGVYAVGYNAAIKSAADISAFEQDVRETYWPNYKVRPAGERDLYTPILYIEPLTAQNESALGFDIYSEPNRRAAIDRAISTGQPAVTAKIQLVQENTENGGQDVQAGILVVLPVFDPELPTISVAQRTAATDGIIVSVFRMGDLVSDILEKQSGNVKGQLAASLYDGADARVDDVMFLDSKIENGRLQDARFTHSQTFDIFGRDWTFKTLSTPMFEDTISRAGSNLIAITGILFSLLLTSLAFGQAARNRDNIIAAQKISASKDHIQILMGEVNHRSKNLLSLVQAIARQTARTKPTEFIDDFGARLSALSASQDLLVKNEWRRISLNSLITSQLGHFENLIGPRIIISGPEVEVKPSAAQTIGMAIHELGTNAGKYGALSNDDGRVEIIWNIDTATDSFNLSWVETGGPPVEEPKSQGFGSRVTGVITQLSLKATVTATYEQSGFKWHFQCAIDNLNT